VNPRKPASGRPRRIQAQSEPKDLLHRLVHEVLSPPDADAIVRQLQRHDHENLCRGILEGIANADEAALPRWCEAIDSLADDRLLRMLGTAAAENDADVKLRWRLAIALGTCGVEPDVELLRGLTESMSEVEQLTASTVQHALEVLKEHYPHALPEMLQTFDALETEARSQFAADLAEYADRPHVIDLLTCLAFHPDPHLCRTAVESLAQTRTRLSRCVLERLGASHRDPTIRRLARNRLPIRFPTGETTDPPSIDDRLLALASIGRRRGRLERCYITAIDCEGNRVLVCCMRQGRLWDVAFFLLRVNAGIGDCFGEIDLPTKEMNRHLAEFRRRFPLEVLEGDHEMAIQLLHDSLCDTGPAAPLSVSFWLDIVDRIDAPAERYHVPLDTPGDTSQADWNSDAPDVLREYFRWPIKNEAVGEQAKRLQTGCPKGVRPPIDDIARETIWRAIRPELKRLARQAELTVGMLATSRNRESHHRTTRIAAGIARDLALMTPEALRNHPFIEWLIEQTFLESCAV